MESNKLNNTLLRSIQYRFEDGIIELVTGGIFLLAGIYFYLQAVMANSQLAELLTASFALVFIGGWYLMQYSIRSLKERITFPRTGFVAYRKNSGNRAVRIIAAVGIAILAGGLLAFSQIKTGPEWNLMPPFSGLVIAIALGLIGLQTALPRFYLLALISLVLGGFFAPAWLSNDLATAAFCGAIGVVLLVSGGAVLRHYLSQNSAPTEASDDK